ncbi:hypothetical protein ES708_18360 [subsurface metagenome]|jgi:hypothetical protein
MNILVPIGLATILYLIFIFWYRGWGKPMSKEEIHERIQNMKKAAGKEDEPDGEIIKHFREVAESDDGKEFFMVNLIKYKDNDPHSEAMAANARYSKAIFPLLLKHGSFPVFMSNVKGRFLYSKDSDDWDQVAIIRYRSRKDFFEMAADAGKKNLDKDKWLSIEKTNVFPVKQILFLGPIRIIVGAVLLILTLFTILLFP